MMTLFTRLRYALYLAIVCSAAIGLVVSIASSDVIGLLPGKAFDVVFSRFFILAMYAVAFVLSPWVAERFPIKRGEQ